MKKDNNKTSNMLKKDYIILSIIVFFYSVLSFINLGSLKNPQTFYKFSKNEELIIELSGYEDLHSIKIYNGRKVGNYEILSSLDNKNYVNQTTFNNNSVFCWEEQLSFGQVKYIKVKALKSGYLGNISLYNTNNKLISINNIISSNKNNIGVDKLIDEKSSIPKKINYLNSTYFDEVYFARTAYEYSHGIKAYEWVHPPLGKVIQAIPIKLSNTFAPFYYRLMGNIAGIIMIIVMYLFCKSMFKSTKLSVLGALLMSFDTFHFAQTRMGTVDSFLVLFIMFSYFYMYKYINSDKIKHLLLSGLFFGLSLCIKWIGLISGLGLAIIFFIHIIKDKKINLKLLSKASILFIILPLILYFGIYLLFPNNQNMNIKSIPDIIENNKDMYNYHSKLKDTHPFSSKWYSWPISYKPVWYYQGENDTKSYGSITGIGNIVIWWFSIITFIYTCGMLFIKKNKEALIIVCGALSIWLPYIFIGRCMFLYHYFSILPFVMLSIVYFFKDINKRLNTSKFMYIYISLFISFFIIYYPVVSGIKINSNYISHLKLLKSWNF
ncbi:MAG: glycosyltransferase family 39 protein [Bacilli bacterium]|nr:glycosyltransferase family 39 protein [Bacilli bacterium]